MLKGETENIDLRAQKEELVKTFNQKSTLKYQMMIAITLIFRLKNIRQKLVV